MLTSTMTDQRKGSKTKLDRLFEIRDRQREAYEHGVVIIRGDELAWEQNDFGKTKWYMHPDIPNRSNSSFLFYSLEIPPGSRTGRMKTPGDEVVLFVEGEGYTEIDGIKHAWKAGDVLGLPMRQRPLVVQHFNSDKRRPATLVSARPNLVDALGLDRGVGFELLESAPESERL